MTTEEFKKLKPEYAQTEGEELWNAMEGYMLIQQQASGHTADSPVTRSGSRPNPGNSLLLNMPKRKKPKLSPKERLKRFEELYDKLDKAGEILPDGEQRFNALLGKAIEPAKEKIVSKGKKK